MHKKEKKDLFLKTYHATFGAISKCCLACGIARKTYYLWIDDAKGNTLYDKDFHDAILLANQSFVERVEAKVWEKIDKGDTIWMRRYLQSHAPEKWGFKDDEESGGTGTLSGTIKLDINRTIV